MPEEDDEALGKMLGDRLKDTKEDTQENEPAAGMNNTRAEPERTEVDEVPAGPSEAVQTTQVDEDEGANTEATDKGTVRSRSPFPLYVTPDVKQAVQDRFEKFNAQRTLNDEPQVEKHKHFMEGLLQAGLDNPDLEEYVLSEFDND